MTLSETELERYSRQLVLPEWSGAAQEALKSASVIVVGAGALGNPVATYLAAAGVGQIGIVDSDVVELHAQRLAGRELLERELRLHPVHRAGNAAEIESRHGAKNGIVT